MTFVQLKPGITYAQVAPKVRDLEKSEKDNSMSMTTNVILDPLGNWHLYDNFDGGKPVAGFIEYVRIFSVIGILVLLIACVNFMNLSTAQSEKRAREVGVRKVIGSQRKDLILQFLIESIVITTVAAFFAIAFTSVSLVGCETSGATWLGGVNGSCTWAMMTSSTVGASNGTRPSSA